MTLPIGKEQYILSAQNCEGCGLLWTAQEFDSSVDTIMKQLSDNLGTTEVSEMLASVVETEFEQETLRRVLDTSGHEENWRVGEAIAESYLIDHRSSTFPWSDIRDQRKRGSSLPGADLIGISVKDHQDCFAFGEVKTSSDQSYPPSVIYGEKGLSKQLQNLRDDETLRSKLVLYLAYRAKNASWLRRFKNAASRFLADTRDIKLFGFLVRDVRPDKRDLESSVDTLGENHSQTMLIELIALYLPFNTISELGSTIKSNSTASSS